MSTVLLKSSNGACAKHVTGPETPALFTTISTVPNSLAATLISSLVCLVSLTSHKKEGGKKENSSSSFL